RTVTRRTKSGASGGTLANRCRVLLTTAGTSRRASAGRVARIAAHVGDISRHREGFKAARELQMAEARQRLDWESMFSLALFGDHAREIHGRDGEIETCTICGELCAVRLVRELFGKKGG
ncbi:MAG: phosphomethylpyrimidine synthase ThiC, partial [Methanolinea sp.]